jgi:glycosyltransferase involved in cell wall biosynthesis
MNGNTPLSEPVVSLGLPVFNGENYLAQTLDSILAQSFKGFELIISDNASTDATQSICENYARKDDRIRYIRQSKNLGAAANYDFTFHEATGELFKWCAHDDILGHNFLRTCVAHLNDHPEDVGALPQDVRQINPTGKTLDHVTIDLGPDDVIDAKRFALFAPRSRQIHCAPFFALFRRKTLASTNLHGDYLSSDRVLIAEMLLHGHIALLKSSHFSFRVHDQQYSQRMSAGQDFCIDWIDPKKSGKRVMKHSRYVVEFARSVNRARLPLRDRMICYGGVARLFWSERRGIARELFFPFYRNGKRTKLRTHISSLVRGLKLRIRPDAK